MQRRKHRTSPLLLETNVTIGADDKDFQWKEFFDGQAHGIHDKMKDMFDRSEEISDRPAVAADYARLCKHRDEQEAIEREKKRKEAKRVCARRYGSHAFTSYMYLCMYVCREFTIFHWTLWCFHNQF